MNKNEYLIEHPNQKTTILTGTLRLPSPTAYTHLLEEIRQGIEIQTETYTIDISGLKFLNSSGLTALARLFLLARQKQRTIKIICSHQIPWQKKSIGSLQKLWVGIELVMK